MTKETEEKISVRYIRTHTNHTPGIKKLTLPQTVREEVRDKYGQNIKLDSIIDSMCTRYSIKDIVSDVSCHLTGIRGNLADQTNRDNFLREASRATFITRQDARNIIRTMDNALRCRHENDAISVERLVQELGQKVIIGYKPQGVTKEALTKLTKASFLLVIRTDFQAQMYEKHISSRIVCVDSTHKTNPYDNCCWTG